MSLEYEPASEPLHIYVSYRDQVVHCYGGIRTVYPNPQTSTPYNPELQILNPQFHTLNPRSYPQKCPKS